MAGPAVSIIVPDILTIGQLNDIRDTISDVAEQSEGFNFFINNHLFLWHHGEEYPGNFEEYEGFSEDIWKPKDQIGLIAMCNRGVDHKNLAELSCLIADQINGMIDLGSSFDTDQHSDHKGRIHKAYYESCNNKRAFSHVCDTDFLRWWLTSPSFRMIK